MVGTMLSFYQEFNKTKKTFFSITTTYDQLWYDWLLQGRNYVGDMLTDIGKNVVLTTSFLKKKLQIMLIIVKKKKKNILRTYSIMKALMLVIKNKIQ